MRAILCILCALGLGSVGLAQSPLADVAKEREALLKEQPTDWKAQQAHANKARAVVRKLLEDDGIREAADFRTAADLIFDPMAWFENDQLQYELYITAAMLGDQAAISKLPRAWDMLLMSMGLGQRYHSYKVPGREGFGQHFYVDPNAPGPPVQDVLLKPDEAKKRAAAAKDNPELQTLVDADQKDRQNLTPESIAAMQKNDPARRARVLEILAKGDLATAQDFYNAGLVLQHGEGVPDFELAHELCLASALLGNKEAPGLVSRTYDRWLLTTGHRQRFGTQLTETGYMPFTEDGPSMTMRRLTQGASVKLMKSTINSRSPFRVGSAGTQSGDPDGVKQGSMQGL